MFRWLVLAVTVTCAIAVPIVRREVRYCESEQWGSLRGQAGSRCTRYEQCAPYKTYADGRMEFYWQEMPCAPGTLWDENVGVCNHERSVQCTDGTSQNPSGGNQVCPACNQDNWGEMRVVPGSGCKQYYHCTPLRTNADGTIDFYWQEMPCAPATLWDEHLKICNHEYAVQCSAYAQDGHDPCADSDNGEATDDGIGVCPECNHDNWGEMRVVPGSGCKQYYHCTPLRTNADGTIDFYWQEMPCAPATLWDQNLKTCNHEYAVQCRDDGKDACANTDNNNNNGQTTDEGNDGNTDIGAAAVCPACNQDNWGEMRVVPGSGCKQYYHCTPLRTNADGTIDFYWQEMPCAPATLWDEHLKICNHENAVQCSAAGQHGQDRCANSDNGDANNDEVCPACNQDNWGELRVVPGSGCKQYYHCTPLRTNADGTIDFYWQEMPCAPASLWDEHLKICNHEDAVQCKADGKDACANTDNTDNGPATSKPPTAVTSAVAQTTTQKHENCEENSEGQGSESSESSDSGESSNTPIKDDTSSSSESQSSGSNGHDDNDTSKSETVDNGGDNGNTDGETVDNGGENGNTDGETVDNGGDNGNTDAETVDNDGDSGNTDGETVDNGGDNGNTDGETVDNGGDNGNTDGETVDNGGDNGNTDGETIDNGGDNGNNDGEIVDNGGDNENTDGETIDNGGDNGNTDGDGNGSNTETDNTNDKDEETNEQSHSDGSNTDKSTKECEEDSETTSKDESSESDDTKKSSGKGSKSSKSSKSKKTKPKSKDTDKSKSKDTKKSKDSSKSKDTKKSKDSDKSKDTKKSKESSKSKDSSKGDSSGSKKTKSKDKSSSSDGSSKSKSGGKKSRSDGKKLIEELQQLAHEVEQKETEEGPEEQVNIQELISELLTEAQHKGQGVTDVEQTEQKIEESLPQPHLLPQLALHPVNPVNTHGEQHHDNPTPKGDGHHDHHTPHRDGHHDHPTPHRDGHHDHPTPHRDDHHDHPTPKGDHRTPHADDHHGHHAAPLHGSHQTHHH